MTFARKVILTNPRVAKLASLTLWMYGQVTLVLNKYVNIMFEILWVCNVYIFWNIIQASVFVDGKVNFYIQRTCVITRSTNYLICRGECMLVFGHGWSCSCNKQRTLVVIVLFTIQLVYIAVYIIKIINTRNCNKLLLINSTMKYFWIKKSLNNCTLQHWPNLAPVFAQN